jgi:hypothetical protein
MFAMSRLAWLACCAIGCAHPAAPAPPGGGAAHHAGSSPAALEDDLPRMAERMAKMYRDWQQALAEATDCATATTRLNALVDANADLSEANRRVQSAGHDKVRAFRLEREKYDAGIDASAKAIFESPLLATCKRDPGFTKAFDRLGGEG